MNNNVVFEHFSALPMVVHDYTFLSVLGDGGSSVVYLVSSKQYPTTQFAAKVTSVHKREKDADINLLKGLSTHPNVVLIYDYFEDNKFSYLIMEYCPRSLADVIKDRTYLKNTTMIYLMLNIVQGLQYCHSKNVAHRDIKPKNILIDAYGRPKLTDFGISIKVNNLAEEVREFSGSGPYTPPEIILKMPHDPFKADIWSLGVTFYEIVFGTLPWENVTTKKQLEGCICQASYSFPNNQSNMFTTLIGRMLSVEASQRPSTSTLMACSLFRGLKGGSDSKVGGKGIKQSVSYGRDKYPSALIIDKTPFQITAVKSLLFNRYKGCAQSKNIFISPFT